MKITITLIVALLLVGTVSAAEISISPAQIELQAYPGESISTVVNITTDGVYPVYLSHSSENITLIYTTPLVVEHKSSIPITILVSPDAFPKKYIVSLTASVEYPDPVIQRSGGRGGGSRVGGTYRIVQNSTTQDKSCSYTYPSTGRTLSIPCNQIPTVQTDFKPPIIEVNESNYINNITEASKDPEIKEPSFFQKIIAFFKRIFRLN